MTERAGSLYIVPTPLGNLEDITLRALQVLKDVDLICAEDTRHSRKLLTHFGISTKLTSYYREKERQKTENLIKLLKKGKNLALISDAGTPAISDPGAILIGTAHKERIRVIPLPGASAIPTALSASGIIAEGFLFLGFLPAKSSQRKKILKQIRHEQRPVILYESPRRVEKLLEDALEILGDRDAFWARELTKTHEELLSSSFSLLLKRVRTGVKGELVLIVHPAKTKQTGIDNLEEILLWHREHTNTTIKDVSKKVSKELGISRSIVYQKALTLWKERTVESPSSS